MTIVPMDRSHLKGVAELERLCFSTPWNEAMLEEELYNDTASFLVAEGPDGTVVGYAGLHVILDEGYIDNVAVRPDRRRQGIADRLLEVFCRFGAAHLRFLNCAPAREGFSWRCMRSTASARRAAGGTITTRRGRTPCC